MRAPHGRCYAVSGWGRADRFGDADPPPSPPIIWKAAVDGPPLSLFLAGFPRRWPAPVHLLRSGRGYPLRSSIQAVAQSRCGGHTLYWAMYGYRCARRRPLKRYAAVLLVLMLTFASRHEASACDIDGKPTVFANGVSAVPSHVTFTLKTARPWA